MGISQKRRRDDEPAGLSGAEPAIGPDPPFDRAAGAP